MINKDTISGALLFLLAAGYLYLTNQIAASSLSDEVGADGLPRLLAFGLFLVATLILVKGILSRPTMSADVTKDEAASLPRALGFAAIGFGYMLLAPLVGFAFGIAALMIAVALYEGERASWKLLAVAAATGLGFWTIFVRTLGTTQPAAWLLERLTGA